MHNYGNTGYEVLSLLKNGVAEGVTSDPHDTTYLLFRFFSQRSRWYQNSSRMAF